MQGTHVEFCEEKEAAAASDAEKRTWVLLKLLFDPNPRKLLLKHLGLSGEPLSRLAPLPPEQPELEEEEEPKKEKAPPTPAPEPSAPAAPSAAAAAASEDSTSSLFSVRPERLDLCHILCPLTRHRAPTGISSAVCL
jgi:hypothetical protein